MKHPPYHLRPNKAVDRLLLVEIVRSITQEFKVSEYTYYGFGGPYLEDIRLLYSNFPEIGLVSIEQSPETVKRQEFHRPCAHLDLQHCSFGDFIANFEPNTQRSIFWLDYTNLKVQNFAEFEKVVGSIGPGGVVKVCVRAETQDWYDPEPGRRSELADEFRRQFERFLPDPAAGPPGRTQKYVNLIQCMFRVVAQDALRGTGLVFQPISSFYYSDGATMYTLTGVICEGCDTSQIVALFSHVSSLRFGWEDPEEIRIPDLSLKEKLFLERCLPCGDDVGSSLLGELGYFIDKGEDRTVSSLSHYAMFHRYDPFYLKVAP